ncbi:hypothetical protein [Candidatus Nitrospira bockiana]
MLTMLFTILARLGPVLAPMIDRAFRNWRTSVAGAGASATTYYIVHELLQAAGCPIETLQVGALAAAVPSLVVGLASMDKSRLLELSKVTKPDGSTIYTAVDAQQTDANGNPIPRS